MADTSVVQSPATSGSNTAQKKAKSPKAKKVRSSPSHPKVSEMVNTAISNLKERGGSSLQAIKKYISSNYKLDAEKISPFIKKYLKTAVANGVLIQTKGKGASGSFKLSASQNKKDKKESATIKKAKPTAEKKRVAKPKKVAAEKKKVAKPKKSPKKAEKQKKVAEKKPRVTKKAKTPKKEKKAKSPKKPKSPKPKKAAATKKTSKK